MNSIRQHPSFPQPEDPSATIWRYMDFYKFSWIVECGRLLMPSADRLGDPLEGTRPAGDLDWWSREAANAISDDHRRIIEHNCELITRFATSFRSNYYVSCWHMNPLENADMWPIYTTQPESVAIWSTYATLREILPKYVDMGKVRYIDYITEPIPRMNMFEYITHKNAAPYSFECEVRAIASSPSIKKYGGDHFTENLFESEATKGFRVYAPKIDVLRLTQGVVLHPEASAAFEVEINNFCARYKLPQPVSSRFRKDLP